MHDSKNPLAVLRASLAWLTAELATRPDAMADVDDALRDSGLATARLTRILDDLAVLALLHEAQEIPSVAIILGPIVEVLAARHGAIVAPRGFEEARFITRGDVVLVTRVIEAAVETVALGAARGAVVEISAELDDDGLAIVCGARGDDGPFVEHDPLLGTGLAMLVASEIATAHGGAVSVVQGAIAPKVTVRLASG
ncbi:MAG: hypothetical protein JST00_04125 [Deltaproteobacteria bacterium]|nr:hypothetical protein [Deltaproteobacteria bacterium]